MWIFSLDFIKNWITLVLLISDVSWKQFTGKQNKNKIYLIDWKYICVYYYFVLCVKYKTVKTHKK